MNPEHKIDWLRNGVTQTQLKLLKERRDKKTKDLIEHCTRHAYPSVLLNIEGSAIKELTETIELLESYAH